MEKRTTYTLKIDVLPMTSPAIDIRNLKRNFETKLAVNDLSLRVRRGEIFGFLGPNGAGKSTTMKMMCGLLQPSGGTVRLNGLDVRDNLPEYKMSFGYLPESPILYQKLSAREELDFVGRLYGLSPHTRQTRIEKLLKVFKLEGDGDRFISQMSKGMKQKVALSQCLLHNPGILLLDEPTSGLDPRAARMVKDLITTLHDSNTTIFLSSHRLSVIQELCDRIGIIHEGKLVALGKVDDIIKQSKDAKNLEEAFLEFTGGIERLDILDWRND